MEWKSYFRPEILSRGRDYFYDDLVEITYIDKTSINTIVYGTEEYKVEIEDIGTEDMTMICDCPYALEGNYCKHIAASMMVFEDLEGIPQNKQKRKQIKIDHNKLVQTITNADEISVKSFLFDICLNNSDVYEKFMNAMINSDSSLLNKKKSLDTYKKEINSIYKSKMRKHFIDYYNAIELFDELELYLEDELESLYDDPVLAINIMNYAVMQFKEYAIDDSAGGYIMLLHRVASLSEELIEDADEQQQNAIFNIYLNLLNQDLDVEKDMIEDIFYNHFNSEEHLNNKLLHLERIIVKSKPNSYEQNTAINYVINVYNKLGLSAEEIITKLKPYASNDIVRNFFIDVAIQNGKHEQVINLIKEGMQSKHSGIVNKYHEQLINYYKIINHKAYAYELFQFIIKQNWINIDKFRALKAIYTQDEWEQVREYVFRSVNDDQRSAYYFEEKLYDRLMEGIVNGQFYYGIFLSNKEVFIQYDLQKSLVVYEHIIQSLAKIANNRKDYRSVMRHMIAIQKIKGGAVVASRLAEEWRIKYKRRRAMMDELDKIQKVN